MGGWTIIWSHHSYEHTWVFTVRGYWGWGRVKQSSDHTTAQHIWGATQSVIITRWWKPINLLVEACNEMPINQQIAYTLTRSNVSNSHLMTRNMRMCMHTMYYWLGELMRVGIVHQKSRCVPHKKQEHAWGGPLGYLGISPCWLCHWISWNSWRFYSILALF